MTVLMAAYNDMLYLPEALNSILAQTFEDFEFIVIDDGSTDGLWDYLQSLHDSRIRPVRNEINIGLTRSLNRGLEMARGKYVARMDADDVAAPNRLQQQVDFLDAEPQVGILGSGRELIDEQGRHLGQALAMADNLSIRWRCMLGNPFAHPTVMLRKDVLDKHGLRYDEAFRTAQDYELWSRLLRVTRGANISEPLLRYRLRAGISVVNRREQLANHDRIARTTIRQFLPAFKLTPDEVTQLRGRFGGQGVLDPAMSPGDVEWARRYLELLEAFSIAHYTEPGLRAFNVRQQQVIVCATAA